MVVPQDVGASRFPRRAALSEQGFSRGPSVYNYHMCRHRPSDAGVLGLVILDGGLHILNNTKSVDRYGRHPLVVLRVVALQVQRDLTQTATHSWYWLRACVAESLN